MVTFHNRLVNKVLGSESSPTIIRLGFVMSSTQSLTAQYSQEYLDEYNGENLRAIAILFICLVTISVALRFYAHRMGNVKWGYDDSLIIPGTVFCLALCISCLGGYI